MNSTVLVAIMIVGMALGQSIQFGSESRLPCRMVCSTNARFTTIIDGVTTTAQCTENKSDPSVRCPGCCQSVALAAGVSTDKAVGFPSNDGKSCVCCIKAC